MIDPNYAVAPTANMFFMIVSTFLITILGWFVTDKIVEPRLSKSSLEKDVKDDGSLGNLSDKEKKALKYANLTFLALVVLVAALTIPQNGLLRNAETGSIIDHSPLMNGFVPILTIVFLIPSIVFGKVAGIFKNEKDLYKVAIAIALRVNFNPNDLKLITAIIVIIALASNNGIFKFKNKKMCGI